MMFGYGTVNSQGAVHFEPVDGTHLLEQRVPFEGHTFRRYGRFIVWEGGPPTEAERKAVGDTFRATRQEHWLDLRQRSDDAARALFNHLLENDADDPEPYLAKLSGQVRCPRCKSQRVKDDMGADGVPCHYCEHCRTPFQNKDGIIAPKLGEGVEAQDAPDHYLPSLGGTLACPECRSTDWDIHYVSDASITQRRSRVKELFGEQVPAPSTEKPVYTCKKCGWAFLDMPDAPEGLRGIKVPKLEAIEDQDAPDPLLNELTRLPLCPACGSLHVAHTENGGGYCNLCQSRFALADAKYVLAFKKEAGQEEEDEVDESDDADAPEHYLGKLAKGYECPHCKSSKTGHLGGQNLRHMKTGPGPNDPVMGGEDRYMMTCFNCGKMFLDIKAKKTVLRETGEEAEDDAFLDRVLPQMTKSHAIQRVPNKDITCGFAISTTDQYMIEARAEELSITLGTAEWEVLSRDIADLESAVIKMLDSQGFTLSSQGHSSDDALVGNIYINPRYPNVYRFLTLMKPMEDDENRLKLESDVDLPQHLYDMVYSRRHKLTAELVNFTLELFDIEAMLQFYQPMRERGVTPEDLRAAQENRINFESVR